jgi:hypothetical protein
MAEYLEQYQRVQRYLGRIQDQERDRTEYEDDLWSFFQNCWHLKDWLAYDDSGVPLVLRAKLCGDELKTFLQQYTNLRICADLANRTKHLKLKKPWLDAKARGDIRVDFTEEATPIRLEYRIVLGDNSDYDALDVARQAVEEWDAILVEHGLSADERQDSQH